MASTSTPAGAGRASRGTTASPGSTCVTGILARTQPLVRTGMGFTSATVHLGSLVRTVTRWWTGAPAILVKMERNALRTAPPSTAPALGVGLGRCVMFARCLVRLLPITRAPLCLACVRMEVAAVTLGSPTPVIVGMGTGAHTANMNLMPAHPIPALMEQPVTTSGQPSAVTVLKVSWVPSASTILMTVIQILVSMEELAMILLETSPAHALLELKEADVRRTWMNVMLEPVSMEESVLTELDLSSVSVIQATQGLDVREISTSAWQTLAHPRELQTVCSC